MIMVSTFYAIAWLPLNVYYILMMFVPGLRFQGALYYVTMFVAFVYTSANPFIYATNFDAVRKVLVGMIRCRKNSTQPTEMPVNVVPRTARCIGHTRHH